MNLQKSLRNLLALAVLIFLVPALPAIAATFTVTNANDSGAGSLRQAMTDANAAAGADTVVFGSPFSSAQTIQLATSLPDYNSSDPLTITGPGSNLLTVRGNDTFRIFTLTTNSTVTLSGMTITNGRDTFFGGGGIYKQFGTLSITNVVITANAANGGGGVQLFNGAILNAANSTISNNAAINGEGGGISAIQSSLINLTNTTVSGNTATGSGAGIRATDGATAVINGSTFTNNATTGGAGGGVSSNVSVAVSNSTFTGNSAYNGGGAISNTGTATVTNCNISNNSSARGDTFGGAGGGGIASGGTSLTIIGSNISNNTSARVGGGIARGANGATTTIITDSTISNNTVTSTEGSEGGGGIILGGNDTSTITRTTISGNSLVAVNDGNHGGGIRADGSLNLVNSLVTGNSSPNNGGGIYISADAPGSISGSTISNNIANSDQAGGGAGVTGNGGGIYAKLGTFNANGLLTISNSTISGNMARPLTVPGNTPVGGGIYDRSKNLDLINTTISGNYAPINGAMVLDNNGGTMNFTNTTIARNTDNGENGDGNAAVRFINAFGNSTVNLRNMLIADNTPRDLQGTFTSQGYNLLENTDSAIILGTTTGNIIGVDPQLAALADNGGLTLTHALLAGSPALDAGSNALAVDQNGLALTSDQRAGAFQRIVNGTVDIGAFEVQPPPNTQPGSSVTTTSPAADASVTFPTVTRAGLTKFNAISPTSAGTAPAGYTIRTNLPAYEIDTTAGFTPPLLVSFTVPASVTEAEFGRLRILHREGSALVDRTIRAPGTPAPNFATRTLYARVDSLSPFVLATAPGQLQNISTRLRVRNGDNALIGGFIVTGTVPKRVILRAIGPSLSTLGVPGALADPTMELRAGDGSLVAGNNNWRETQQDEIIATTVPPSNDFESAIVATLTPGNYTAIVRSQTSTPGVGLVEVYDLDSNGLSRLANISTRGFVETGEDVMIGGFIVGPAGSSATRVIVRAIGPSLTGQGVSGALADTMLDLRDGNGALVATNDNWRSTQEAEIIVSQVPPTNDLESAIVADLAPGNYTAIVRGNGGNTGIGLVEVFRLQYGGGALLKALHERISKPPLRSSRVVRSLLLKLRQDFIIGAGEGVEPGQPLYLCDRPVNIVERFFIVALSMKRPRGRAVNIGQVPVIDGHGRIHLDDVAESFPRRLQLNQSRIKLRQLDQTFGLTRSIDGSTAFAFSAFRKFLQQAGDGFEGFIGLLHRPRVLLRDIECPGRIPIGASQIGLEACVLRLFLRGGVGKLDCFEAGGDGVPPIIAFVVIKLTDLPFRLPDIALQFEILGKFLRQFPADRSGLI